MADKEEREYRCLYCKNIFKQMVGRYDSGTSAISSQVVCPRCGNFLKTW